MRVATPGVLLALWGAMGCGGGAGAASPNMAMGGSSMGGQASMGGGGAQGSSAGQGNLPSSAKCDEPWPANAPKLVENVWTRINPPGPVFKPQGDSFVQGMAIDPCNPSTIYVTSQNFTPSMGGGLYKSIDAGASWARVGTLDEPIRVRVDPKNPLHLYAGDGVRGSTLGFWVSQDGGNSWAKPASFMALVGKAFEIDDIYDVAVDPSDFNHALLTFHYPWGSDSGADSGVLETPDAGSTWVVHPPVKGWGAGLNIWFLDDASSWLLGSQSAGYFRTADSGKNWKLVSMQAMTHGGGQLYKAKNALYTSTGSGVQRSVDDGQTWTQLMNLQPATSVYGDGTTLYTRAAYGLGEGAFMVSPESGDGTLWTPFGDGTQKFIDGPFEMAFDSKHRILYSANWGDGLLALKLPAAP